MDMLTGFAILVFAVAIAGAAWLAMRSAGQENEQLNESAKKPDQQPTGGGGPRPTLPR